MDLSNEILTSWGCHPGKPDRNGFCKVDPKYVYLMRQKFKLMDKGWAVWVEKLRTLNAQKDPQKKKLEAYSEQKSAAEHMVLQG